MKPEAHPAPPPPWARAVGVDAFGSWATLAVGPRGPSKPLGPTKTVQPVEQRMRWIAPGRFWMGSPPTEVGRWDDEGPRHEVTLTGGYWLADTPCTQQLWQAVMGRNPSHFQSPRRPVEQVSWDEVQRFLAALGHAVPGLRAGLPTEAQWEHACRAGTTTATYGGDLEIRGENDAPILDAIAWYGGNSGVGYELAEWTGSRKWPSKQYPHEQAGTREVACKQPNAWGLFDMLGNVYELCADGQRTYDGPVTDPRGTLGPRRARRGGGWFGIARCIRAARRAWVGPDHELDDVGFRLCVP